MSFAENNSFIQNTSTNNIELGKNALLAITSGINNIAIGPLAGSAITSGNNNLILGGFTATTLATSNNNIIIADGAGNLSLSFTASGAMSLGPGLTNFGTTNQLLQSQGSTTYPIWTSTVRLAGTAGNPPVTFTTGTISNSTTTLVTGAIEFDGALMYSTPAFSTRGLIPSEQFIMLANTYTLTSQTGPQKLFSTGSAVNGALYLQPGTYFFESQFTLTGMSATTGNGSFDIKGAGTAVLTAYFTHFALDNTAINVAAAVSGASTSTNTSTALLAPTATGTGLFANIYGVIRVTTAGTIIPSIALTTAAAAIVQPNAYFRVRYIGTATSTVVGNWS